MLLATFKLWQFDFLAEGVVMMNAVTYVILSKYSCKCHKESNLTFTKAPVVGGSLVLHRMENVTTNTSTSCIPPHLTPYVMQS